MASVPIPVRATVRDVLRDLIDTKVTVTEEDVQQLDDGRTAYCSVYVDEAGAPTAAIIADLDVAAAVGGALARMNAADVQAAVGDATTLEGELYDSWARVAGELAGLLNSPSGRRVEFDAVHAVPGDVPTAVAGVVTEPAARADYTVTVEGHRPGVLTLVTA